MFFFTFLFKKLWLCYLYQGRVICNLRSESRPWRANKWIAKIFFLRLGFSYIICFYVDPENLPNDMNVIDICPICRMYLVITIAFIVCRSLY